MAKVRFAGHLADRITLLEAGSVHLHVPHWNGRTRVLRQINTVTWLTYHNNANPGPIENLYLNNEEARSQHTTTNANA